MGVELKHLWFQPQTTKLLGNDIRWKSCIVKAPTPLQLVLPDQDISDNLGTPINEIVGIVIFLSFNQFAYLIVVFLFLWLDITPYTLLAIFHPYPLGFHHWLWGMMSIWSLQCQLSHPDDCGLNRWLWNRNKTRIIGM